MHPTKPIAMPLIFTHQSLPSTDLCCRHHNYNILKDLHSSSSLHMSTCHFQASHLPSNFVGLRYLITTAHSQDQRENSTVLNCNSDNWCTGDSFRYAESMHECWPSQFHTRCVESNSYRRARLPASRDIFPPCCGVVLSWPRQRLSCCTTLQRPLTVQYHQDPLCNMHPGPYPVFCIRGM